MTFTEAYKQLLILQYSDKPNAVAEIEALVSRYARLFDFYTSLKYEMDVDNATGHRQDIIGVIVGVSRYVDNITPNLYFGYEDNPYATGYNQALYFESNDLAANGKLMADSFYQAIIQAKINKNNSRATSISGDKIGIQDSVKALFLHDAYVVNNNDMTITLNVQIVDADDTTFLAIVQELDIVPRPQGVKIIYVTY